MKIFLIGMPGSGKSTLGKHLAETLEKKFIDLDQEIADKEGKPVKDIFKEDGEGYFRKLEAQLLRKISESNDDFILATGGGTPCFYDSMNFMNNSGTTIFLNIEISDLVKRVVADNGHERPLLKSETELEITEKLNTLFTSRIRFYEMAKLTVDANNVNKEFLIQELISRN